MNLICFKPNYCLLLICYFLCFNTFSQTKIIEFGKEWKYYSQREAPIKGWESLKSATSSWEKGKTPIGYGEPDLETVLSYGGDEKNKIITAYFTTTFYVEDPSEHIVYLLKTRKDDGLVLYLNGHEIFRVNMPLGEIGHTTKSYRDAPDKFDSLDPTFLYPRDIPVRQGENILSATVHQASKYSPDLIFDLEFTGYNDLKLLPESEKERVRKNPYLEAILKQLGSEGEVSQKRIIGLEEKWKYYSKKAAPPKGWENSHNITSGWKTGEAVLGYGNSETRTIINHGDDDSNKILTYYFTKSFHVEDPFECIVYQVKVLKDDGVVLYLNGREIFRVDMPLGEIDHVTKSSRLIAMEQEEYLHTAFITPEDINQGENILSASVHQASKTSSDLSFDLQLIGHYDVKMLRVLEKERTIKNLYLDSKLKQLEHQQEIENINLKQALLTQKNDIYKMYFWVALILVGISIIVLLQVVHTYKEKRIRIAQSNMALRNQYQIKGAEMMNISLGALSNQQFLKSIKKDIEDNLKHANASTIRKEMNRIISNINFNSNSSEDWENLKKHFDVVHSGYVDKLSELHPILTNIELRHCIFIKLHMQTKEIANILHIDPRSVQSSRYRIKKKMGLEENVDLKEYLMKLF
ncbi:hypothetical protein [uncultured Tenacibaculum sp.]|uniref:helix-turn-helix transcriptional regulator n=1 Tax=uncultured Tenacibaculum sp. TaxID=174713 RepID=UPI00261308C4|nr:hypothetical protein [uncultured Tenacibaculum sp.]